VLKSPATVFTRRAVLAALAAALLTSCGGGGSGPSGSGTPAADSQAIVRLALNPTGYYFASGIAVGPGDTLFVANPARRNIFKLTQDGVISDFVDSDGVAAGTDGTGSAVGFSDIGDLVFDKNSQVLYVQDDANTMPPQTRTIRRITTSGATSTITLSTFPTHAPAGSPLPTDYGNRALALALGADGTLYATTAYNEDRNSGSPHGVKYVALQLGLRTIDGNGGGRALFHQESGWVTPATDHPAPYFPVDYHYPADLGATAGMLSPKLYGLAVDRAGNGYIADADRHIIVKITPDGAASIFAGTADKPGAADGAGAAAQFHTPAGMVIDKADNLYVADHDNHTIRKITPSGTVSTVVGVPGLAETRTGALPGGVKNPRGLAIDDRGRLYVTVPDGVLRIRLP
jgi:hypothetical protein